jgi:hypothetical protein
VERDHLAAVHSEHPQRVRVPQILLLGHGEPGQVAKTQSATGGDPGRPESFRLNSIEGQQPVHQGPESLLLEFGTQLGRHGLGVRLEHHRPLPERLSHGIGNLISFP